MKITKWVLFTSAITLGIMVQSCSSKDKPLPNAQVTIVDEGAKDAGLDLQALGELIKKSPNPTKLEEALNTTGSINNLDLDKDGKVDYVKVNETVDGNNKVLKFVDEQADGTKTEVASVTIQKGENNQASMDINGNQAMYGDNYSYHSGFSFGEVLLMAYLFSPHTPYYSPWGYRSYPGYYRPYAPVPVTTYRRTVTTYNSHPTGGSVATPAPRRSVSSPTSSQRSFTNRDASKPVGSGGFGSRSTRNATSSPSSPSTSSSRSSTRSSGFGSRSSSSSSSSSRSSSSSSSRRSFGKGRR
jgi:hypothetical protein